VLASLGSAADTLKGGHRTAAVGFAAFWDTLKGGHRTAPVGFAADTLKGGHRTPVVGFAAFWDTLKGGHRTAACGVRRLPDTLKSGHRTAVGIADPSLELDCRCLVSTLQGITDVFRSSLTADMVEEALPCLSVTDVFRSRLR
jgi:hypothetical protein